MTEQTGTVLVVDDEPQIVRALRINLTARGYKVVTAHDGAAALRAVADTKPDVVVLDLGLPDIDGTDVITGLRGWTTVPIIVLSARGESPDKVKALDLGADDYVTKPFGMDELLARLRAAMRRSAVPSAEGEALIETESFTLDLLAKKVHRDGVEVHLTKTEWGGAGAAGAQPGPVGGAEAAAARGVGSGVRERVALPAGLPGTAAAETGAGAVAAEAPDHRARDGVPLRGLIPAPGGPAGGAAPRRGRAIRRGGWEPPLGRGEPAVGGNSLP